MARARIEVGIGEGCDVGVKVGDDVGAEVGRSDGKGVGAGDGEQSAVAMGKGSASVGSGIGTDSASRQLRARKMARKMARVGPGDGLESATALAAESAQVKEVGADEGAGVGTDVGAGNGSGVGICVGTGVGTKLSGPARRMAWGSVPTSRRGNRLRCRVGSAPASARTSARMSEWALCNRRIQR